MSTPEREFKITSVSVGVSMKRTARHPETDEFKTYEAHETWTFEMDGLTEDAATVSNQLTQKLMARVMYALHAVGAVPAKEVVEMVKRTKIMYNPEKANAVRPSASDLSGATDSISPDGTQPAVGPEVLLRQDAGVSPEAGQGSGPPGGSQ